MTNPELLKLSLHYPGASKTTRRIVEGRGDLATRVKASAEEQGLPLGENLDLVQLCARVDFGERLDGKLLEVIAETVSWLRAAGQSAVEPVAKQEG